MSKTLTADNTKPTKVFVNNVEQPNCVAVNVEEGWAEIACPELYVGGNDIPSVIISGDIRLEPIEK